MVGYDAIFEAVCAVIGISGFAKFTHTAAYKLTKSYLADQLGKFYDDYSKRQLSQFQLERLNTITHFSIVQFYKLIKQDNWSFVDHPEAEAYTKALYESQDHLIYRALQEAQRTKDELYGCFWGNLIYEHDENWNDLFYIINIFSRLSFRQLLLIKLINEGFAGVDRTLSITNPVVSVEMQELYHLGLWDMLGKYVNPNYNNTQDLFHIKETKFSKSLYDRLSLKEKPYGKEISDLIGEMQLQSGLPSSQLLWLDENGNFAERPQYKE